MQKYMIYLFCAKIMSLFSVSPLSSIKLSDYFCNLPKKQRRKSWNSSYKDRKDAWRGQGDKGTAFFWLYPPFYSLTLCYSFIYEKQFLSLLIFFISKSNDVLIYTPYTIKRGRGDKKSLSPCPPVPFMRRKFSLSYFSSKQMIALDNVNNSFRYYKP